MTSPTTNDRIVRVASGQGFWGDSLDAPRQQVEGGPVDYLMLDYLAEVTMSILQKQKERDPNMGYARDFLGAIESVLPAIVDRGVRVIANAGGVNPVACAHAVLGVAAKLGAAGKVRVGVVTGDDLLPRIDELLAGGHELRNMDTGEPLSVIRDRVLSANAYIGSTPIVEALARGANVVVTGRSTDTALTMAPLRHEFGWAADDWNALAAGIVAGHILECGAQCSGGNCLHDWRNIPDLANVGYPIAEARADGSFVITKHPGTGGRVSFHSVAEQLVYEMGDPHSYITPDVVADFTSIRLEEVGPDRVRVHGIAGTPATDKLKVSIAFRSGWKAVGTLVYAWPDAMEKAQLADRVLRERLDRLGLTFDEVLTEFVGASATHGALAGAPSADIPEVQLRVGVRGGDRASVERFTREIAPLVLNGPPSVTGFAGGRPKVEEIVAYWPALVDKTVVQTQVEVLS
ncbi:MAG: acyclic terpene utilization AtuA family protein [Gemmatirosa sp.]